MRAGLADLHAWQASFGSLDLQTRWSATAVRLAVHGLRLAAALDGPPDVLFEWSERARMLVSRVLPVRAPADERVAADLDRAAADAAGPRAGAAGPERRGGRRAAASRSGERAW